MRYLLLIYSNEMAKAQLSKEALAEARARYENIVKRGQQHNVVETGEPLQPTSTATTVRVRDGRTVPTDGPYAETKEQLCGYFLLNCDNLDEAIEWASRMPAATDGAIEIRPIHEMN